MLDPIGHYLVCHYYWEMLYAWYRRNSRVDFVVHDKSLMDIINWGYVPLTA
jgi:hypothetical protein